MHLWRVPILRAGFILLAAFAALPAPRLCAQIFKVQGGDSTLFQAQGGSLDFKARNYSGSLGAGMFAGHFQMGANFRTHFDGFTFTGGDDSVRFDLPTDIFDTDYYFSARGLGISHGDKDEGYYAFGGMTSTWLGTGFFQSAKSRRPGGNSVLPPAADGHATPDLARSLVAQDHVAGRPRMETGKMADRVHNGRTRL